MIYYKFKVLEALNQAGYSTYRLRKEHIIGESSIQRLRDNSPVNIETLNTLCELLGLQPGDIIGYKKEEV